MRVVKQKIVFVKGEVNSAGNRILRAQIKGRLCLSRGEKATLAEIAHRLGRKALAEVAVAAKPDTILGWFRELVAGKFDGPRFRLGRAVPSGQSGGRLRSKSNLSELLGRSDAILQPGGDGSRLKLDGEAG